MYTVAWPQRQYHYKCDITWSNKMIVIWKRRCMKRYKHINLALIELEASCDLKKESFKDPYTV